MQRQAIVRPREPGVQAVRQHRPCALHLFLRGLADHHERARPQLRQPAQDPGRAEKDGHVHVMPARVHDPHRVSLAIGRLDRARERSAGLLRNGERVEVGPHQHGRPLAAAQDADDAVAAHPAGHLETELLELIRHAL